MHLPRLWTDAPVVMKTQVNRCKEGQTRQGEPLVGPDRGKKGPTQRTRRARQQDRKRSKETPEKQEVKRGVRPEKVEEGEGGGLCLTPCGVFKMVAFVCSESVIPAIPDSKRDRVRCFTHCGQVTYFIAFGVERSYIILRYSFA